MSGKDNFREWLEMGTSVAEQAPELRQVMADALMNMEEGEIPWDHLPPPYLPMLDEAVDRILAMMGPLASGDGCLCCHNPRRADVPLCEMCVQDHGAGPTLWPAWVKRRADDRAARLASAA